MEWCDIITFLWKIVHASRKVYFCGNRQTFCGKLRQITENKERIVGKEEDTYGERITSVKKNTVGYKVDSLLWKQKQKK